MRKTLIGIVLTAAVLLLSSSLIAQVVTLPEKTAIKLKLKEPLLSENTHPGDSVAFEVADSVEIDGLTVIPEGALAYGNIEKGTKWARRLGRGAWIFLELKNVTDITGREIPILEPRDGMGSNRPDQDTSCMSRRKCQDPNARYMQARGRGTEIALSLNPFMLLLPGKDTYFPTDQIFVVVTAEERRVDLTNLKNNCGKLSGCKWTTKQIKTEPPKPSTPEYQQAMAAARAAEYQKAVAAAQAAASAANRQVVSRRPSVYALTGDGALIASR
jgi:hypothetical protein